MKAEGYCDTRQAEGKIQLLLNRLAAVYPFHVHVLEQFKVVAWPEVNTMGVTIVDDDVVLFYNTSFVLDTLAPQLGGVLLHEVHHVVLGHVVADPAEFPDDWARTVAEEVTVNEFIREPLPEDAVTLAGFTSLPPMESTKKRYARLRKAKKRPAVGSAVAPTPSQVTCGSQIMSRTDRSPKRPGVTGQDSIARRGQSRQETPGNSPGDGKRLQELRTVDDHSMWQEARRDPARSKAVIRGVVQRAVGAVDADQVPRDLVAAVDGISIGNAPAEDRQELAGIGQSRLKWQQLLRRYVGRLTEVRPVFNRPPRRFPELVGVLPGRTRQAAKPKIMAVLDTSGSVTRALLEEISAELEHLARHYYITVVECDAAIQRVYPYRPLKDVHGRGGTDFHAPLRRTFLAKHRPDVIIYFTDGLGPAPTAPPSPPLIWCLTADGRKPASWGKVIRMDG